MYMVKVMGGCVLVFDVRGCKGRFWETQNLLLPYTQPLALMDKKCNISLSI